MVQLQLCIIKIQHTGTKHTNALLHAHKGRHLTIPYSTRQWGRFRKTTTSIEITICEPAEMNMKMTSSTQIKMVGSNDSDLLVELKTSLFWLPCLIFHKVASAYNIHVIHFSQFQSSSTAISQLAVL